MPSLRPGLKVTGMDGEEVPAKLVVAQPYRFDDPQYTVQSKGRNVPLYRLRLTAAEWAIIDWLREAGAAAGAVRVDNAEVGDAIGAAEYTVQVSLASLVKMGIALKPAPRSATYQLNPTRFWEGSGYMQARTVASYGGAGVPPIEPLKERVERLRKNAGKKVAGKKPAAVKTGVNK